METKEIVLKVLKYLYIKMSCDEFDDAELIYYNFGISKTTWDSVMDFLLKSGYVSSNLTLKTSFTTSEQIEFIKSMNITSTGLSFLMENEPPLPSATLLLSIARSEYELEFQRTNTLDVKVSILIAFIAFLFPSILELLKFENASLVYIIISIGAVIFIIIALFMLLWVISTKPYDTIPLKELISINNSAKSEDKLSLLLALKYNIATEGTEENSFKGNRYVNSKRAKIYRRSLIIIVFSFIFCVTAHVLKTL